MSTSKSLQKAAILEIIGSTLRIKHPDVVNNIRTSLGSPIAAAGTAMTVIDNNGFADDNWLIVGEVGDPESEEVDVNGTVTRGTSLTVTNTLKFAHEIDAPVTKIYERGIKIYGAATDGGSGTLIASVDAVTTPIADAVMIQWNKGYTEYTLINTDTAYAYYYVKFTDGTTEGAASDYIASSGLAANCVEKFIKQAINLTNSEISSKIKREDCIQWADDAQSAITQYLFRDPLTGMQERIDWDFEVLEDTTSLTISENTAEYNLSSLTLPAKYLYSDRSIISLRIGSDKPLKKIGLDEFEDLRYGVKMTQVATQPAVGATSLVVDSVVEFADSGTLYVGTDILTYTGKSGTTTFIGIPASGTGSITEQYAVDSNVWQGLSPSLPKKYLIFNGKIVLDKPAKDTYEGYPLKIRYIHKLTSLTEASDTTLVTFTNAFQYFIAARIEEKKQNFDRATYYQGKFDEIVYANALNQKAMMGDEFVYYEYADPFPNSQNHFPNNQNDRS